jgi:hypothetical protein
MVPPEALVAADPPSTALIDSAIAGASVSVDSTVAAAPERHRSFQDLKPGKDILHGAGVTVRDAWAVLSGPAHMNRGDLLWTVAALGTVAALYSTDQELLDAFHRNHEDDTYKAVLWPGRKLEKLGFIGSTAPYYAGGLVIGYLTRFDPLTQMTAECLESHMVAGIVRNLIEPTLGRTRPRTGKGPRNFEFGKGDSFPSGHASVVFEVATVVAHHTESTALRILAYALATSISLQRVDSDSHWPSDIVAGAMIGTVVARTLVRRHQESRHEKTPAQHPAP